MQVTAIVTTVAIASILGFGLYSSGNSNNQTGSFTPSSQAVQNDPFIPTANAVGEKSFWINTVHLDGNANINGDDKHPPEPFPYNASYPGGGGFVLTPPNKSGAWNFRSFTFEPSQIVVYLGDKVTLNFVGVQGPVHMISVDNMGEFQLKRGEVHSLTFTADKVGVINYWCHIHMPNMHGQVLVLPKPSS